MTRLFKENWTFLLGTILIPLIIWGWGLRQEEKPLTIILKKIKGAKE